jgi:hypothetical protein
MNIRDSISKALQVCRNGYVKASLAEALSYWDRFAKEQSDYHRVNVVGYLRQAEEYYVLTSDNGPIRGGGRGGQPRTGKPRKTRINHMRIQAILKAVISQYGDPMTEEWYTLKGVR